jgi:hypothetical protein
MFLEAKWFCHDIRPIKVSADFDNFNESLFDLVLNGAI